VPVEADVQTLFLTAGEGDSSHARTVAPGRGQFRPSAYGQLRIAG
jgi:hypothetical protein